MANITTPSDNMVYCLWCHAYHRQSKTSIKHMERYYGFYNEAFKKQREAEINSRKKGSK